MATRGPQILGGIKEATSLWSDFQQHIAARGARVLYLVLPVDPSMNVVRNRLDPDFDHALLELEELGASVVDWRDNQSLSLRPEDFFDQQHLLESGRRKLAANFNTVVVEHLDVCNHSSR